MQWDPDYVRFFLILSGSGLNGWDFRLETFDLRLSFWDSQLKVLIHWRQSFRRNSALGQRLKPDNGVSDVVCLFWFQFAFRTDKNKENQAHNGYVSKPILTSITLILVRRVIMWIYVVTIS